MSFYIENNVLYITKGDDAVLEISGITAEDGSAYEIQSEDLLTLTVREKPTAESQMLLEINSIPGSNRIVIRHEDTVDLNVGMYSADIQMLTDGKRHTIWPRINGNARYLVKNLKNFVIMPEVGTK